MHGVVEYDISPIRGPLANAFVILINALFFKVKLIGLFDVYPRDYSQQLLKEDDLIFDFIVVGAGSAGCAVANRLSEQEAWSVLLIEAGDYPPPASDVPGLYTTFIRSNEDWKFLLETDNKACQALADKRCLITRGKVLGGTSTINNMQYVRGTPDNYDRLQFDDWSANISYSIFEQIESFNRDVEMQYVHGKQGQIHLDVSGFNLTPKYILEEAYRESGYVKIPRRKYLGFTDHLLYMRNGERINMAKAFLTPVKERPNLFFTRNTEVESVVILEPTDKRASGVNVVIDGIRFFIRAKKEVVLTAGTINNAKLLLVSGIGPKKYLESKKISSVADLPAVGKNLQFHLTVPMYVSIEPCCDQCEKDIYSEFDLIGDVFDYVMYRTGNLSNTNVNDFTNYIITKKTGATLPNVAIHHIYFKIGDRNFLAWLAAMDYHPKLLKSLMKINQEKAIIMFLISLISPLSRGEVLLNQTHHLGNPAIYPHFLSDEDGQDLDTLLGGFNYVTNLTDTASFKKRKATFLNVDVPNCRNLKFCTMPYVKCYITNMGYPNSDLAGTAKMGEICDQTTVVKKDLEVKEVRCLRVADSSVLGYIPIGNTVATDAMIGYHMGEILKEKWVKDYVSPYHAPQEYEEEPTPS